MNPNKGYVEALDRVALYPETGCWIWLGSKKKDGYGMIRRAEIRVSPILAHRFFFEQLVGAIPKGLHLHHVCQRADCVNPRHMEITSPVVHARRHWAEQ